MRIYFIFIILVIFGCTEKISETTVTVNNETSIKLDSVVITVDTVILKFSDIESKKAGSQLFVTRDIQKTHDDNAFGIFNLC